MSSSRKIFKNSAILISQSALSLIISVVVNGYIARKLGTADYGKFIFAFSFATMFSIFGDMGTYGWGVKEIARQRQRTAEILGDLLVIRTFLSSVTFLVVCILINYLNYPALTRLAVYIGAVSVILCGTQFTNVWIVFEAHERVKYEGLSNLICRILVALLSVYFMWAGYGFIALALVYMFGSFIQIVYCYYILKIGFVLPKVHFSLSRYAKVAKEAVPFTFVNFFIVLYYEIDKNMLSFLKGDSAVGLYNSATSVAYKGTIISGAIAVACLPAMIRSYEESRETLSQFVSNFLPFLCILGIPIAGIFTVFAKEIIDVIYRTDAYHPAIITLQIIVWMIPLEFMSRFSRYALIASNKVKFAAYSTGIGLLINIMLNLYLIRHYSYNGAAAATVFTEMFILVFQMVYFHRNNAPILVGASLLSVCLANIIFICILLWLKIYLSFGSIIVSGLVYVVALYLLGALSPEYFQILRNIFIKRTT